MGTSLLTRIINRLRGRRSLEEYYAWLLRFGRIVEGEIIEVQEDETGTTVYYRYRISNVHYESAHALLPQQLRSGSRYKPGDAVTVRFDPRHPARSVVQ